MKEKALNRRLNALFVFFLALLLAALAIGWLSGYMWASRNLWSFGWLVGGVTIIVLGVKRLDKLADKQLHDSRKEEKGADGERDFAKFLNELPDTYTVICDLDFADSYGNIDHLVIGPTGVFAIDVKRWSGNVTSDGKGELLLNGKPTDKPQVRYFTRRTMDLKDRIKALARLEPYVQCVFAFLHTHVDAKWGTTGAVHCIRADQIVDYVTKARTKNPIPPADLPRLVSAAKSLKENPVQAG